MALAGLPHYSFLQTQHRLPLVINCTAQMLPFTGRDWGEQHLHRTEDARAVTPLISAGTSY